MKRADLFKAARALCTLSNYQHSAAKSCNISSYIRKQYWSQACSQDTIVSKKTANCLGFAETQYYQHFQRTQFCYGSYNSSPTLYNIYVYTGDQRGAGSPLGGKLQLIGENGRKSSPVIIGVDENDQVIGFQRGQVDRYSVETKEALGAIKRIEIDRDPDTNSEAGSGWFLDKIIVQEEPYGFELLFPCKQWLGDDITGDFSGPLHRNLVQLDGSAKEWILQQKALPKLDKLLEVKGAGFSLPHPDKPKSKEPGKSNVIKKTFGYAGEDAYFFANGRQMISGLGVADGVYSWKEQGIDSGQFSRCVMEVAQNQVKEGYCDVLKVLRTAARKTQSEGVRGSSTACVLTVNQATGLVNAANLGDSGYIVISPTQAHTIVKARSNASFAHQHMRQYSSSSEYCDTQYNGFTVRMRSEQQEHEFGRPYQLGHHEAADRPEDAQLESFLVFPGDIAVLGTDGLFDNLSHRRVLHLVVDMLQAGAQPSQIARALVFQAFDVSLCKDCVTPYSRAACENLNMVYSGGKKDDITAVVARLD